MGREGWGREQGHFTHLLPKKDLTFYTKEEDVNQQGSTTSRKCILTNVSQLIAAHAPSTKLHFKIFKYI